MKKILVFIALTLAPVHPCCNPPQTQAELDGEQPTPQASEKQCSCTLVSCAQNMYKKCMPCIDRDDDNLLKNFTPTTYITCQTEKDEALIKKMRAYFFEKEDRTFMQNMSDLFLARDPYAARKEAVYKRCINEAGAQERILLTEDGYRISSLFFQRDNAPFNIIYVAGYFRGQTPTKEWSAPFAQIFHDCNVLSFDWRGFADSDGNPAEYDLRAAADVQAAVDFLRTQNDKPIIAVGFCFGAALMLHTVEKALENGNATPDALVINSTPTFMENMKKRAVQLAPNWVLKKIFSYQISQDLILTRLAGELFDLNPLCMIKKINLPMLFEYYTGDKSVPPSEGIENFNMARHPAKSITISEVGGHVRIHSKAPNQYRTAFLTFAHKAEFINDKQLQDMRNKNIESNESTTEE